MLVVGANLTLDRTLRVTRLEPGCVIRPREATVMAGGKAVNVCRAASAHGVHPTLIANLPGELGEYAARLLDAEGIEVLAVPTSGELRGAIIVLEDDGRATVLNEPGPPLSVVERARLLGAIDGAAATGGGEVVVVTGSVPPGEGSVGLYAEIVRRVRGNGGRVVLDAARDDLTLALEHHPDVVTPNLAEALAVLTGAPADEAVDPQLADPRRAAQEAASALVEAGAGVALVTVGRHGVGGASGEDATTWWIPAPVVEVANPIGAGDAFAAGVAAALEAGCDVREASRWGVATGAASVTTATAGHVDVDTLRRLLGEVGGA